jgi:hypothetical protein
LRKLFWFDAVNLRERAHVLVSRSPAPVLAPSAVHVKRAEASISAPVDSRRRGSLDPIFSHSGDIRVAASVTLAGVIFSLIAGTVLALDLPLKLTPQFPTHGSMAAAPTSGPVRIVGTTASSDVACEQQTWPYTDQRCLTRTEAKPRTDVTPVTTQSSDKISPINATAPVVAGPPPQQDGTTGSAPQNEPAQPSAPPRRGAINAPAAPDAITADADDDAPRQPIVEPARRTRTNRHNGFHVRFGGFRPF